MDRAAAQASPPGNASSGPLVSAAAMFSSGATAAQPVTAPSSTVVGPAACRAAELKKQLYDKDVKLIDLFGDLEPKLMLDAITESFWASCLQGCGT